MIGRVCETANEKGYQIEVIHNCLDNRPEGVILPQFQSGLMNIPAYVDMGIPCTVCLTTRRCRISATIC